MSEITVLFDGYSEITGKDKMKANCTSTLVQGKHNIIVDTMTAWDSKKIKSALDKLKMTTEDINFVISTHGHSDHIGNNYLFLKARHIVGFSISFEDTYFIHPFDKGEEYVINDSVKVIPTPGHTMSDVTVLVINKDKETVAITGDIFEKFEDIQNPNIWFEAGSEDPVKQMENRLKVASIANWIIPGHGPMFKVTDEMRECLRRQCKNGIKSLVL